MTKNNVLWSEARLQIGVKAHLWLSVTSWRRVRSHSFGSEAHFQFYVDFKYIIYADRGDSFTIKVGHKLATGKATSNSMDMSFQLQHSSPEFERGRNPSPFTRR
jgi:hypothetical protein